MRPKKASLVLAAALTALTAPPALAGTGSDVKVGGVVFSHYGVDLSAGADHANEFDITRVYLTVKAKVSDSLSTRITTDVGRLQSPHTHRYDDDGALTVDGGQDTKLTPFIKYAYLQWTPPVDGVRLQFGAAGTGWTGLYDKFWGRRWVSKSFGDQTKVLSTSDLGVHAAGAHKGGLVQWHGGLLNGAGYGKPEGDKAKTAQLRLTVDPMAGGNAQLPVSAFASHELGADGDPVTVMAAALGYKSTLGLAWCELIRRSQGDLAGQGVSASLVPHVGGVASLLIRVDRWDPDTEMDEDAALRLVGGITKDFAEKVSAGVLYERSQAADQDDPDHGVFIRMQAGF